jgi:D-serine dehydratase
MRASSSSIGGDTVQRNRVREGHGDMRALSEQMAALVRENRTNQPPLDVAAVERLRDLPLPPGTKGLPLDAAGMTLGQLADSAWHVLREGLPMPLMVLKESALAANLAAMAAYCHSHGVSLCPHGKTTMAPQLFRRQLEAGAWGLTAATPSHLRAYRRFGVERVIYANQLVEAQAIRWVAGELERDPRFELVCLADSEEAVALLDRGLAAGGASRPLGVLVEAGFGGGRCGVRDREAARRVAAAVDAASMLELRGVECFEGLGEDVDAVDALLAFAREVAGDLLRATSLRERDGMLVSAGGSAWFDRVVETFVAHWEHPVPAHVVLRSGCYLTQDGGFYARSSPLHGRCAGPAVLRDAIEIWSAVLSRPEPGRAICSMGRPDAPQDMGPPVPVKIARGGGDPLPLAGASVAALSDQHGHLELDARCSLDPGDLVACAISHPCTAFDKWKVVPVVDDGYVVRDAVATLF